MLSFNRSDKVNRENCGTETTSYNFARHKKNVHLEQFIELNVPNCQHLLTLISFLILQKKRIVNLNQRKFTSVIFVIKFLLVFIPSRYLDGRWKTRKMYRRPKKWLRHIWWDRLTMRNWRNSWKRSSPFFRLWNENGQQRVFIFAMEFLVPHTLIQK